MRISAPFAAVLSLAAGGIGGWYLRGPREPSSAAASTASRSGGSSQSGGPLQDGQQFAEPPPRAHLASEDDDEQKITAEEQAKNDEAFLASVKADLQWQLGVWKSSLNLRPDQMAQLQEALNQAAKGAIADPGDSPESDKPGPQQALEDALGSILDPDQAAKYANWLIQRDQARYQLQAAGKLSEMEGVLMLDPKQREAIGRMLAKQAEDEPSPPPPPPAPSIDRQMIADLTAKLGPDGMADPKRFKDESNAWIDQRIETEMAKMKPLLSAQQLESYHQLLDRKYRGWTAQ